MFKIREFAQLGQVSVKTLRYYDELGLLKPAHTDRWSGYRYYAAVQLLQLHRILAFKELGFTLEQIIQLLDEQLPCDQIRGMFRLKQAQTQNLIASEQQRLARLEAHLQQIEQNDSAAPQQDVVLKRIEPQLVASRRLQTAAIAIPALHAELATDLRQQGLLGANPLPFLVLWHGCENCEDAIDLEVAYPLASCPPTRSSLSAHTLPAVEVVASLLHHCQPGSICRVGATLAAWIEAQNYTIIADQPRREIYLAAEENGMYITEVQIPLRRQSYSDLHA